MIVDLATIFFLSALGSWHCAGMCGAFCLIAADSKKNKVNLPYHLGRLTTYTILATTAYFSVIPVKTLLEDHHVFLFAATLLFVFMLFWFTLSSTANLRVLKPLLNKVNRFKNQKLKAYFIGSVTTLLPCAWLYGFIAYGALKPTLIEALLSITLFWLGTLPALFAIEYFSYKAVFLKKARAVALVCLFILATAQLYIKINTTTGKSTHGENLMCTPGGKLSL